MQQTAPIQPDSRRDRTWVLSDGRAGNHRQAMALAKLLQRSCREFVLEPRKPWSLAAPRLLPFAENALPDPIRDVVLGLAKAPDLVIGCGRQAAMVTRILRRHGSFAIQILNPRIPTRHWDRVITPEHDQLTSDNVICIPGAITDIDDTALDTARQQFSELFNLPTPRIAVLLGGDTHKRPFEVQTALVAIQTLIDSMPQASLMVSTSRRTPRDLVAPLRQLIGQKGVVWSGVDDAQRLGQSTTNPYMGYLAAADTIVCSADSVAMLSESAATSAPLYLIGTLGDDAPSRFAHQLMASGRAKPYVPGQTLETTPVAPLRAGAALVNSLRKIPASAQ